MAECKVPEEIKNDIPQPKLDQAMISELASMLGLEHPAFSSEEVSNNWSNVQDFLAFKHRLSNVLCNFYSNALHEKTEAHLQNNRREFNAEDDRRLDRAIDCALFLAEFLRDLDNPDKVLELDYSETAEAAADVIDDAATALKSYRRALEMRHGRGPSRRGRKSHESLRGLVFGLVCLYERYSGKRFTFFRHRERGEYVAVSHGHRFVLRAAQVWIGNVIDANSLAVECERVKTHWSRVASCDQPRKKKGGRA